MQVAQPSEMTPVPVGERLIIAYKFGKAALEALGAAALWVAVAAGWAGRFVDALIAVGHRSVHPLAVHLAHWLGLMATPARLHVVALLLAGDAVVSAAEGWVLRRGYPWGRWLVVLATGTLLPIEVYEILRRLTVARAALFVVNAAIVVYLVRRVRSLNTA